MKKAVVHNAVLYKSPIGDMVLCARGRALTGAWFVGQQHFAEGFEIRMTDKPVAVLKKAMKWLDRYFQGENPEVDFPIEFYGTPFQKNVWQLLRIIPMGVTISYSELAKCLKALTGTGKSSCRSISHSLSEYAASILSFNSSLVNFLVNSSISVKCDCSINRIVITGTEVQLFRRCRI